MHTRLSAKHVTEDKTEGKITVPQGELFKLVIPDELVKKGGKGGGGALPPSAGIGEWLEGNMAFLSLSKGDKGRAIENGKLKKVNGFQGLMSSKGIFQHCPLYIIFTNRH